MCGHFINDTFEQKEHLFKFFGIFQYSNNESIPSITTTQYIDELVKNGCIDVEQSSNASGNKNSIDPKQGWTKMSSQVQEYVIL